MFEAETFANEGPLWPCGCIMGNPACRCGAESPTPAEWARRTGIPPRAIEDVLIEHGAGPPEGARLDGNH